jgi:hypothetical protein
VIGNPLKVDTQLSRATFVNCGLPALAKNTSMSQGRIFNALIGFSRGAISKLFIGFSNSDRDAVSQSVASHRVIQISFSLQGADSAEPPCGIAAFVVNSEPQTGAGPSIRVRVWGLKIHAQN